MFAWLCFGVLWVPSSSVFMGLLYGWARRRIGTSLVGGVRAFSLFGWVVKAVEGPRFRSFVAFQFRVRQDVRPVRWEFEGGLVSSWFRRVSLCGLKLVQRRGGSILPNELVDSSYPPVFAYLCAEGWLHLLGRALPVSVSCPGFADYPPNQSCWHFSSPLLFRFSSLGSRFPLPPFLSSLRRLLLLRGRLPRLRLACRWSFVEGFCLGVRS